MECTLGLFLGLQERGYEPIPTLFYVKRLNELPGA